MTIGDMLRELRDAIDRNDTELASALLDALEAQVPPDLLADLLDALLDEPPPPALCA